MGRGECYAKAARLDGEIGYGAASLLLDSVRGLRAGDPAGAAGGPLTRGGAAGCARVLSAAVRGALRFGGETGAVGALRRADVSARARGGVSAGACWPGVFLLPALSALQGFFLSYSVACFAAALGRGGVKLALCAFGVRCAFILPCTFFLAAWGMRAAYARLRGRKSAARRSPARTGRVSRCARCCSPPGYSRS